MKPMLAATVDDSTKLNFPLYASPKLDGIRALVIDGVLVSRNLKPIPNAHIQRLFGRQELNGVDGELICGPATSKTVFSDTTSAVMSRSGEPDVQFYVFDMFTEPEKWFSIRSASLLDSIWTMRLCKYVHQTAINNHDELIAYEQDVLQQGYEGVMLRSVSGRYKFGRSTLREGALMKLKRFTDCEATIIGFEEQMHNGNEAKVDALGHTERSTHKAGKSGKGTLGALRARVLNGEFEGVETSIGSGMNDALRASIWGSQDAYLNQIVKFKYFSIGSKDAPRFPVFLGFRNAIDF